MQEGGAGSVCAEILAVLPKWFGLPDSVEDYVAAADTLPTVVATLGGSDTGILTLRVHSPYAAEIVVMGVRPEYHRAGIGRSLLGAAETWLAGREHRVPPGEDAEPAPSGPGVWRERGLSTSGVTSGRSKNCPSCGARTSRRCR